MLKFQEFFTACTGQWQTERVYHDILTGEVERSYTQFRVEPITQIQKQKILSLSAGSIEVNAKSTNSQELDNPGFTIAFDTRSESGETVSMSLQALFVPDADVLPSSVIKMPLPVVAKVVLDQETSPQEAGIATHSQVIQGYYLRDQGYSEAGAIAGRFTYQPIRQTLEMTTYYRRSVAVDQMRMIAPNLRLRTIVTYQRPTTDSEPPSIINLVGFGVERRQSA